MRIILVSDSHGNRDSLEKLIENEKFDYLFFLGDGLNDLGIYSNMENIIVVSGNCDFFSVEPNERIMKIDKYMVLATHGNRYSVKSGLSNIKEKAESEGVDFVFFGHTHKPTIELINNIYYINPGTFHKDSYGESNYMEVIISGNDIKINSLRV